MKNKCRIKTCIRTASISGLCQLCWNDIVGRQQKFEGQKPITHEGGGIGGSQLQGADSGGSSSARSKEINQGGTDQTGEAEVSQNQEEEKNAE